ncbi:MAG: hypothetical protein ACK4YT_13645, partial [Sphingomonas sp.]
HLCVRHERLAKFGDHPLNGVYATPAGSLVLACTGNVLGTSVRGALADETREAAFAGMAYDKNAAAFGAWSWEAEGETAEEAAAAQEAAAAAAAAAGAQGSGALQGASRVVVQAWWHDALSLARAAALDLSARVDSDSDAGSGGSDTDSEEIRGISDGGSGGGGGGGGGGGAVGASGAELLDWWEQQAWRTHAHPLRMTIDCRAGELSADWWMAGCHGQWRAVKHDFATLCYQKEYAELWSQGRREFSAAARANSL